MSDDVTQRFYRHARGVITPCGVVREGDEYVFVVGSDGQGPRVRVKATQMRQALRECSERCPPHSQWWRRLRGSANVASDRGPVRLTMIKLRFRHNQSYDAQVVFPVGQQRSYRLPYALFVGALDECDIAWRTANG